MARSADEDTPPESAEPLTDWDARKKRLYKEALREVLIEFGLDPAQPLAVQQDMAWVRRRRTLEESTGVKVAGVIIGAIVTGAIGAVVYAIQRFFHG